MDKRHFALYSRSTNSRSTRLVLGLARCWRHFPETLLLMNCWKTKIFLSFIYHCFSTDPDFADISRDGQMFVQDSLDIKFYLSHGRTRARQLEDWLRAKTSPTAKIEVWSDRRSSQKSGTRRKNSNVPDLSPTIPDNRGSLRFRSFHLSDKSETVVNQWNPRSSMICPTHENQYYRQFV